MPKGLVKIDSEALYDCDSITELELPEGLRYLGKECLYACGCNYGPVLPGEWGYSKRKFEAEFRMEMNRSSKAMIKSWNK